MQTIPYISISEGIPVIFLPLAFVLLITAMKDLFEDLKRKKADVEENSQNILIWEKENWKSSNWKNLRPGNIVKVKKMGVWDFDGFLLFLSKGFTK